MATGVIFADRPDAQAFAVLQMGCLWLLVQVWFVPYRCVVRRGSAARTVIGCTENAPALGSHTGVELTSNNPSPRVWM